MSETPVVLLTAPSPIGGLETVVAALANGLANAGQPLVLVQLLTPGSKSSSALDAVTHPSVRHVALVHGSRAYADIRRDVAAVLPSHQTAVVHAHGKRADLVGALVVRGTRHRLVSTVHGFITNTTKQRLARRVHEWVLRRCHRVVAVSAPLYRELSQTLGAHRVVLIPNAPPQSMRVSRAAARERLGVRASDRVIGWVGRVSPEKGVDVLVRSAPLLVDRDAVLVVIGEGPDRETAMARATADGVAHRFRWLGAIPSAATLFAGFDLLVNSSRTEGTPMNVLEAIDARVPVVATAVGGVPDLIGDDAGWLVPSDSPAALALAVDAALAAPAEAARRAQRATERLSARLSLSSWIAAHQTLYLELSRP